MRALMFFSYIHELLYASSVPSFIVIITTSSNEYDGNEDGKIHAQFPILDFWTSSFGDTVPVWPWPSLVSRPHALVKLWAWGR